VIGRVLRLPQKFRRVEDLEPFIDSPNPVNMFGLEVAGNQDDGTQRYAAVLTGK
jgi:hypothetical protein